MTKHTKSYLIAWTRNVSYLNLKYQKSVTNSCDWSIVALVTDRAWCERHITLRCHLHILCHYVTFCNLGFIWGTCDNHIFFGNHCRRLNVLSVSACVAMFKMFKLFRCQVSAFKTVCPLEIHIRLNCILCSPTSKLLKHSPYSQIIVNV